MDALALLTADHNRVRGLFARFRAAQEAGDDTEAVRLARKIAFELHIHMSIEEQVFYPWVRDLSGELAREIDKSVEEHHVAQLLLVEIRRFEPDEPEWPAKLTVLMENVEHHIDEEETALFPAVRSLTSPDLLDAMAAQLETTKSELGAPVLADKMDLSTKELREMASEQALPGRSSMDKEELAATIGLE